MAPDSDATPANDKLKDTAIINLALQRDPSLIVRVLHELSRSDEIFPSIMDRPDIGSNENVMAMKDITPKVIDYHIGGIVAIKDVIENIKASIPWACGPYATVMLSLFRGFYPKLYSPNALYDFLLSETERALLAGIDHSWIKEDKLVKAHRELVDLKEMVESAWNAKFSRISFKFGPITQNDFLASASAYDDMIIVHPVAPFTRYWPAIAIFAIARLLLQKEFPKMSERFKNQLAILTVRATIGEALEAPGTCHDILDRHPVDHAQYQIELISKDLHEYGDFDYKLLHFFPTTSMDENYSLDMIAALILFLIDENLDQRDLFARIGASSAGYRAFDQNFMLFQKALENLERLPDSFVKRDEASNTVILLDDRLITGK
ncbi:MAG TPA: hypothetical protein VKM55_12370 [Candidatus Lokiarchaeia archaeon]|nr:hypothetical protein [Candidatus Lokiarchaeia archaeon]